MADIVLLAPLKGWIAPLDETPDAVFAERMMGDGVAIDPTDGVLHAPCDGEVVNIHRARHAVTVRSRDGVEVLMHLGLETVALEGEGFTVHVAEGQAVKAAQPLVTFDLDLLAQRAKSLITPVVVTNGEAFAISTRQLNREVEVGEPLLVLRRAGGGGAAEAAPGGPVASRGLTVPLAHGLHARPAARIAAIAKGFEAEVFISALNRRTSARSPVGIMSLAVRHGDQITVSAEGADAEDAVFAVAGLIEGGMGEAAAAPAPEVVAPPKPKAAPAPVDGALRGVTASPGLAIGRAVPLASREIAVEEQGHGAELEGDALSAALASVRARTEDNAQSGDAARRAILSAHAAFLDDPELIAAARRLTDAGKSAGFAWRKAVGGYVDVLKSLGDRRMAERVDDLLDLERQVLLTLAGEDPEGTLDLPPDAILLADEMLPSQLMALKPGQAAGFCTARGGPTSHVAILAAAMGLPAIVAAGEGVLSVTKGTALILDADAGLLRIAPDARALEAAQMTLATRQQRRAAAQAAAKEACRMSDGTRIEVFANVGSLKDAEAAVAAGAEGSGLLRTEFLFLERETPPDEAEQARQYQAIASALEGRPLVIRTLDIGADKPAPYLPMPAEENPALGLRGVRIGLWRPAILKTQLRAILSVQPLGQCKIMLPMISGVDELRAVRALLDEVKRELGVTETVELGVMVETPAAAVMADVLAAEADFLSIGTNDLTQYVLAMDRGNPELAARIDALDPAVLRLIAQTTAGARKHGRWVGVCGGLASDLAAAPILIGLGVTELSATAAVVPELKALIRTLDRAACRALAEEALAQATAEDVRGLASQFIPGIAA
ncbi:phosphoenolpyruvate--protein phosphotransferase [Caulobacter segnis]|uniref:phosphoenolpyruvate--protein phosphotransferase n=1 Tax=Caulobacter segnis TaxID=88688 RepID=UPI00240EE645|nr:phosphoenolpyruvate--protein phosphotransferase [Caulobacter segnis]MDG2523537.1 phosphoenolpyruvate--protein phosphotransferase [Caulobacter segnis]